jgi:histidinol-phosphate aminotransferase
MIKYFGEVNIMKDWKNNLRNIEPYVPGEQSKNKNIVKINANENPYPPSPMAVKALKEFDADKLRFYPPADAYEFKKALADYYNVGVENVFLGNGSDDVLALSFQAFFNSDLPIAYPDITYSFYPVWCRLLGVDYVTYPLDDNFRINLEDYKAENGGVVIPNPNAPTSICEGREFVEKLMNYNQDCVVIIDEAYVDFGGTSSVDLINKYENLLVTGTFSKSRSLAGMRIGFAIGSKALISVLEAVKNSYNSYTVDFLSMQMGIASIKDDEYFKQTIAKVIATRERVISTLRNMGFDVLDSSANFIMATHKDKNMKEMFEYLKGKNVFIRYFNLPRIDNYVRISIGTDEEMDIFLNEVKNYMGE